ncbi:MAG: acetate--CoA ligase family protein, partial [Rhodoplanes sp.]
MDAAERTSAARLGDIVAPRSVAVVGASEDLGKFGGRVLHHLIKHRFQGRIVPVNPNRPDLFGLNAAPTMAEVGPVDVAVIALPADQLLPCVEDCVAAGVRAAVIITAQMGEVGGEGAARERRIVEIARAGGMRILGPNCLGLVNTRAGLALTASFAMGVERLPVGSIGVVSQSGALMATMFSRGYDFGIGFSKLVSVGNQADVTETEVFEHLISDEATRAIVLYLEGISDGARLLALAEQARGAGKPVIAVKAGRSEAGRRATFSHTASLAGPFKLFASAARTRGIVLTDEPEAAMLIADALVRWPAGLPRGRGVAPCSGSGGAAAIVADRLSDVGLPLAEPSKATCSKLSEELLPGQPALPLDAGALRSGFAAAAVKGTLSTLAADEGVGALVYVMTTQPQMAQIAADFAALGRSSGKPALLVLSAGRVADPIRQTLRESGSAFCDRLDDALRVLRGLADYADTPPLRPTAFSRPNAMEALAGL